MNTSITKIAMDTHKKQHQVAWFHPQTGELQVFTVNNTAKDLAKMVKKLSKQAPGPLHFCYEAGVCGFTLKRRIEALGGRCSVIAPSLVPTARGDRIKTDWRDAKKLLGQFMAGTLTEVYPPSVEQEAARELTRCRQTAQEDLKRSRHRLIKFLTRHGYIYHEGRHWTAQHHRWLLSLAFDQTDLREVFDLYYAQVQHDQQRLASLAQQVAALAEREDYREIVGLLRCFKGIETLTAVTLVTELFAFGRFDSPRQLMGYLGLVPSEHSSGERRRAGAITKAGNHRLRRLLVESAWHARHRPRVGKVLRSRRQGQPPWAVDLADRAMGRLHTRYWRLMERGKNPNVVVVALARELAGFLWAMVQEYHLRQTCEAA